MGGGRGTGDSRGSSGTAGRSFAVGKAGIGIDGAGLGGGGICDRFVEYMELIELKGRELLDNLRDRSLLSLELTTLAVEGEISDEGDF